MAALAQDREPFEHPLDVTRRRVTIFTAVDPHVEVVLHRHAPENAASLRYQRDTGAQVALRQIRRQLPAAIGDRSLERREAGDGAHGRGFAGAIGADQRDDFAGADIKIEATHGADGPVENLEAADRQHHAASAPR